MDRLGRLTTVLVRTISALALMAGALLPAATTVLAGAPAPALSQCIASLWCAQFTVSLGGPGSGSVFSSDPTSGVPDGHIDCILTNGVQSGACAYLYSWPADTGTLRIHLDAAPAMGNVVCFLNKTCLAEGHSTPLLFDLTNGVPTNYSINFQQADRTLTVEAVFLDGQTQLHVVEATNIESIDCPPTCSWQFPYGTEVDLRAHPQGDVLVNGFDACAAINDFFCTVTMTDNINAGFTFTSFTLVTPAAKPTASPHHTVGPTSTAAAIPTSSAAPVASPAASASAGAAVQQSATPGSQSPAAATGPDPVVIGLLLVIAALLGVIAIGIVVVSRRRTASGDD